MKKTYNSANLQIVVVANNIIATSGEPGWSNNSVNASNALVGGRHEFDDDFEDF